MKKILFTIIALIFSVSLSYSQVTTLWEKSAATSTKPVWETGSLTRGIAYGSVGGSDLFFVVTRDASLGGKQIIYYDALTGDSLGQLDNTGITGGVAVVNDVEVSSDGKIFVGNMTTNASVDAFKVYRYDALSAVPVEVLSYNATADRLGDKFTVTGSTVDNSVVIWAATSLGSAGSGSLFKFTTTDNAQTFTPAVIPISSTASSAAVTLVSDTVFYHDAHGTYPTKYTTDGTLIGSLPNTVIATSGSALRYLNTFLGDEYIVVNDLLTTSNNAKIIRIFGGVPDSATVLGSTPLLGSTAAGGLGDVAVKKVSEYIYNIYVLATNNGFGAYQVDLRSPLAGDYYIPQGSNPQGFASLGDAVASLNINDATGTVNFLLDADTLRENSFTFKANLSVDNNVVVKPAPGKDVCLIVTPGASMGNGAQMIGFDKGHVTFDGSNDGSTSRNLIITTETDDARVPFGLNTTNADTVVLKNLIIKNLDNVTLNFRYGAVINDKDGVWGFRVENCQIGTPERPVRRDGLAPWGNSAPNQFSFVNNEIYCGTRGVTTLYLTESEVIGNTITVLPTTAGATDTYNHGIYITGATGNNTIEGNTINCLERTINATSYLIGIAFAGNGSAETDIINVINNMVNVGAADETRYIYGIGLRSAQFMGNLKVYYNTVVINDNANTFVSYGIGNHTNGTGAVNIDLKDNIIINNHTGNTSSAAVGLVPTTSVLTSDYNVLLAGSTLVNYQGTTYADLSTWQAASQDNNSVSKSVNFVSASDLHLTGASLGDLDLIANPISEITTDIDGDTRSLVQPYKGADEGSVAFPISLTIAEAIEDLDNDFVPDRLGQTVTVQGVVFSPNYQTTNNSYYMYDGTAGTDIFMPGPPKFNLNMGDEFRITGVVTQYNGMTEIVPMDSTRWVLMSTGNQTPTHVLLTLAQFKANPEAYEGTLVGFVSLSKASGTWPASGSSATLKVTDGVDTVDLRIDNDTDIDGNTEPTWPVDILGIGSQFDNSAPYDGGYQIFPRFYATDFLPAGTIPVELTSLAATSSNKKVTLTWSTATETNNRGFDIERKSSTTEWTKIGFVSGFGTTTEAQQYSFTDNNPTVGKYSYRLKQIDLNGTFEYSKVVEVEVLAPSVFELSQNYPNPFNPTTKINYSVPFDSKVTISIYSITGELVRELVNDNVTAGTYSVDFNGSNLASGMYIYKMVAGSFVQTHKMMLMK